MLRDAAKTVQLLVPGIDVEEEVFSLNMGVQTVLKRLQYDPVKRVLHVFVPPSCDDDNTNPDEEKKAATFVDSSDEENEGPIDNDQVDVEGIVVVSFYPTSLDLLCSLLVHDCRYVGSTTARTTRLLRSSAAALREPAGAYYQESCMPCVSVGG